MWRRYTKLGTGWLLLTLLVHAAPAQARPAREPIHIGVIAHPRVPAALAAEIVDVLRARYDVTRLGTSSNRTPLRAMHARIVAAEVDLVLLISSQRNALKLDVLRAGNAKRLGTVRVALRGKQLLHGQAQRLLARMHRYAAPASPDSTLTGPEVSVSPAGRGTRHSSAAGATPAASDYDTTTDQADDENNDDDADTGLQAAPDRDASTTATGARQAEHDASAELHADESEAPESADATSGTADEADPEPRVHVTLLASVGSSMRSGEFRRDDVSSRFEASLALAAGLGARIAFGSARGFHYVVATRYATSLERQVSEVHRAGASLPMGLRTHRLEGSFGPSFALGTAGYRLSPALGYALRSVVPSVHFQLIPFYTLGGPFLRLELTTPRFGPGIGLRVSPELQWLPQASSLAGGSSLGASRFAFGGQLAIFMRLSDAFDLEAFLHESHAIAPSDAVEVTDMERFVLANIVWRP